MILIQTSNRELEQLRNEIQQLTAQFERKNGPVTTLPLIQRTGKKTANWNGMLISEDGAKRGDANSTINQQVFSRYANAPCLDELAKELGISINSLSKRAGKMGVSRSQKAKKNNNPVFVRAAQRLEKTAQLLEAGKTVEIIAEKLDISPTLVRRYRRQIQEQEAA